jgi:hypothetical protein
MAIQDAYVAELAASLGSRVGKSQTTTAMTILMHLPKEPQTLGPILAEVRPLLLQQFDSLHPFDQEYLLRMYWEQLRDPSLTPSLKKLLGSTGVASKNIHDSALKRLMEIAPDEARTFVIAEIRDPNSLVDIEILGSLSDKSLPEVDEALLDQILRRASLKANVDSIYLKQKTSLAARYATINLTEALWQTCRWIHARTCSRILLNIMSKKPCRSSNRHWLNYSQGRILTFCPNSHIYIIQMESMHCSSIASTWTNRRRQARRRTCSLCTARRRTRKRSKVG